MWKCGGVCVRVCVCALLISFQGQNPLLMFVKKKKKVPTDCFIFHGVLFAFLAQICMCVRLGVPGHGASKSSSEAVVSGQKEVASHRSQLDCELQLCCKEGDMTSSAEIQRRSYRNNNNKNTGFSKCVTV